MTKITADNIIVDGITLESNAGTLRQVPGTDGSGGSGGEITKVEHFVTTGAGVVSGNQYVDLAATPTDPETVRVTVVGGSAQLNVQLTPGTDFNVITDGISIKRISWTGLGMVAALPTTGLYFIVEYSINVTSPDQAVNVQTDTTNFNGILGPSHTEVQAALDALDDHTHVAVDVTDFTAAAKAAAVADTINNGTTDVAPSQNAVFDALALKSDVGHTHALMGVAQVLVPKPVVAEGEPTSLSVVTHNFSANTTAYFWLISVVHEIEVNLISFYARTASGASTLDIAVYSQDGQTKLIDVTSPTANTAGTTYSTAVPAVTLTPGTYYVGMVANAGSPNVSLSAFFNTGDNPGQPAGKYALAASDTVSAGTLPATFSPTALVETTFDLPILRFDT